MAKAQKPTEPWADAIPVEILRGKEEPEGEDSAPIEPATPPAMKSAARLTAADRLLVAGVAGTIVIGGALYLFRDNIAAQYELRLHPERYWAAELDHRSFVLKMSAIQHEECLVDLLAARMKEPAKVARMKLIGMDEGGALKLARDESAAQEEVCKVLADMVKQDRASVATTEREVARAR